MNKIAFYRIVFKLLRYEFDWEIFFLNIGKKFKNLLFSILKIFIQ